MLICKRTTLMFLWQGHLVQTLMFSGNCFESLTMSSPITKCCYMRGITLFNVHSSVSKYELKGKSRRLTPLSIATFQNERREGDPGARLSHQLFPCMNYVYWIYGTVIKDWTQTGRYYGLWTSLFAILHSIPIWVLTFLVESHLKTGLVLAQQPLFIVYLTSPPPQSQYLSF